MSVAAPDPELEVLRSLSQATLAFRGEATVVSLAEQIVRRYRRLTGDQRSAFFEMMLTDFGPDVDAVRRVIAAVGSEPTQAAIAELARVAEPTRQELLQRINTAPAGTETVVRMRADLLSRLRAFPHLEPVDADLSHLLRAWFNRGFLSLERIGWDSPAAVLERLIEYEAVHEIRSWADLRRRLADDRRCYGFFHPALPGEPLIFIEIALTCGLANSIQAVLDADIPPGPDASAEVSASADTAIFYSITNCQSGLQGIPFGDLLIKQVAAVISAELPEIIRFATLSPVPGFGRWLRDARTDTSVLSARDRRVLRALDDPQWTDRPPAALKSVLLRLCAQFLVHVKSGRMPADPVARFHLRNGARLERINWMGDISAKGVTESAGILVNYLYEESELVANHEQFLNTGSVAHSEEVRVLLAR